MNKQNINSAKYADDIVLFSDQTPKSEELINKINKIIDKITEYVYFGYYNFKFKPRSGN